MSAYEQRREARLFARNQRRLKRRVMIKPGCRPLRRNLVQQAPFIPSPDKGMRWKNGKQVPRYAA